MDHHSACSVHVFMTDIRVWYRDGGGTGADAGGIPFTDTFRSLLPDVSTLQVEC